jgi:hypothetical protein
MLICGVPGRGLSAARSSDKLSSFMDTSSVVDRLHAASPTKLPRSPASVPCVARTALSLQFFNAAMRELEEWNAMTTEGIGTRRWAVAEGYIPPASTGPHSLLVPARRTRHVRFNNMTDPAPIPVDMDFASVIESDVPIVVQHTR